MASFTDQIMQSRPYVQQLPLEAMAQVGMYKQKMYEENVQKIQTQIDNIAGMDIIRDVDKQYLQSKLNELGSKLKTVAGSDFSNFQLVNSVGGMANQIVKDPTIQNALSSTSWYRKQLGEMEKAMSEGKSSTENEWDFNEKTNEWMSGDLKASFRGRYTPYTDVKKKAMEAIKALHPKLQQYDVPFKMNDDGTINTKVIADSMKRYKIEGIDEGQIREAISASLDQNDLNQLRISGRYQFRGVTPEQLIDRANKIYSSQKAQALLDIEYLKGQRQITKDPNEINKIDARIKHNEDLLGKDGVTGLLDEDLKSNVELAQRDPDQVKASLYKDGLVKEFANAFTWKNQITTYETNPIRQQLNWVEDMKFKQKEYNRKVYEFDEQLKREDEKIRLSAEANALKKAELYGDPNASDWTTLGNPTDTKLRAAEIFTNHLDDVAKNVDGDLNKLKTKYSDDQINEMLNDWEENTTKATKIKPDALKLIQNISKNKNYLKSLQDLNNNINRDIDNQIANDPNIKARMREREIDLSKINGGGAVKITAITDAFKNKTASFNRTPAQIVKDIQDGAATLSVDKAALGNIRLRYNVNGEHFDIEIPKNSGGAQPLGANDMRSSLLAIHNHLNKYDKISKEVSKKRQDLYLERLAPIAQDFVPQIKAVATGKTGEPPPIILSRLSQLLTAADVNKIAGDANFDLGKASNMLLEKNKSDTRVFVYQDGDNFQVHLKSESDPSNRQVLKLSKSDIVRYFGPEYVNNKTQESIRLNVGNGNTNLTGDPKEAMLQKQFGNFPGITNLQVTADLNRDLADPDLYTAMINVKKKDGGYATFEISGKNNMQRVGFDQGVKNLNSLTDATLLKLLKEEYPNYDFSNLDY